MADLIKKEETSLVRKEETAIKPVKPIYGEMRLALEIAIDAGILKLGERGRFEGCITFDAKTPSLIEEVRATDPLKAHLIRSIYDNWRDWKEGMLWRVHMEQIFESEERKYIKCAYSQDLCDKNASLEEMEKKAKVESLGKYEVMAARRKEIFSKPEVKSEYFKRKAEAESDYFREYPRKRIWDPDERMQTEDKIKDEILSRDNEYNRLKSEWLEEPPELVALSGEVYKATSTDDYRKFEKQLRDAFNDAAETAMRDMQSSNAKHCGKALRDPIEVWKELGF